MSTETIVLASVLAILLITLRYRHYRRRPHRHSFVYRHYIDNRSLLWRFRRWQWYVTSDKHCEKCGCRVCLHRGTWRYRTGAKVAQFHHLNYDHLLFERKGRDIQMLCGGCHFRTDAWRRR